jgi:hypothetical protein
VTFEQGVALVAESIQVARVLGLSDLLVNTTGLTGFASPSVFARYAMATNWAERAGAALRVALVARAELIDPQKIGVLILQNRGGTGDVFTSEFPAWTLGADLGNTSLLPSLLAGGTLHVLSKDVTTEPARYADWADEFPGEPFGRAPASRRRVLRVAARHATRAGRRAGHGGCLRQLRRLLHLVLFHQGAAARNRGAATHRARIAPRGARRARGHLAHGIRRAGTLPDVPTTGGCSIYRIDRRPAEPTIAASLPPPG